MWCDGCYLGRRFSRMVQCNVPTTSMAHESGTTHGSIRTDPNYHPNRTTSIRPHLPSDASYWFRPRIAIPCNGLAILRVGPNRASRWTTNRAYVLGNRSFPLRCNPIHTKMFSFVRLMEWAAITYRHFFAFSIVIDVNVLQIGRFAFGVVFVAQTTGTIHFTIRVPCLIVIGADLASWIRLFGALWHAYADALFIDWFAHETGTAMHIFAWINWETIKQREFDFIESELSRPTSVVCTYFRMEHCLDFSTSRLRCQRPPHSLWHDRPPYIERNENGKQFQNGIRSMNALFTLCLRHVSLQFHVESPLRLPARQM